MQKDGRAFSLGIWSAAVLSSCCSPFGCSVVCGESRVSHHTRHRPEHAIALWAQSPGLAWGPLCVDLPKLDTVPPRSCAALPGSGMSNTPWSPCASFGLPVAPGVDVLHPRLCAALLVSGFLTLINSVCPATSIGPPSWRSGECGPALGWATRCASLHSGGCHLVLSNKVWISAWWRPPPTPVMLSHSPLALGHSFEGFKKTIMLVTSSPL